MYCIRTLRSYRTLGILVCFLLASIVVTTAKAEGALKAAYLSPVELSHPFWGQIASFLQAVAEDLNIELNVVVEPSDNRFQLKNEGLKIIKSPTRPDILITSYYPGVTPALIEAAKEHSVKVFVFNAAPSEDDKKKVGEPRELFPNWIGLMHPDGTQAGFLLADMLLKSARTQKPGGDVIQVIALRGRESADIYAKDWRDYGLKRRIGSASDASIVGNMPCDWSRSVAKDNSLAMLTQNPDTRVIWAASDLMALGGMEAVETLDKVPGKDILIGGIDWAPEALQAIVDGKMNVSLGGHFMEAGWALILAHDHHYGIDFSNELGTQILTSMQAITPDNVQQYLKKFSDQNWSKVDFKRFSKKHNPKLDRYDFSLDALLK